MVGLVGLVVFEAMVVVVVVVRGGRSSSLAQTVWAWPWAVAA